MNIFMKFACVLVVFGGVAGGAVEPVRTQANVPVELVFSATKDRADPFNSVELDAVFKTPSGKELRVPSFWAGGKTWKVRYASGELGMHIGKMVGNIEELNGAEVRVEIAEYNGQNDLFKLGPIGVAADGRHMAHADGTPFFWLGDTWWMGLCHRLKFPADFATLAADRRAKGFNVVQIVAGLYPDMPPFDPRGANEAGFPWEAKYARIRPEYFDAADKRLRYLVDQGITPCIVGAWGYFMPEMGVAKAKAHWRYLIARYGSWPVVWCVAGEANLPYYLAKGFPFDDRQQVHGWTEVMKYVRQTDPFHRPVTIHPTAINKYTARHATDDASLLDFDMLQTPHGQREAASITLQATRESYAATPTMPVINGEAAYEMLSDSLPTEWTRAMFWICIAEGAAGHTYGANGIWQVNRKGQPHGNSPTGGNYGRISWDEAMILPGSHQLGSAKKFLTQFEDWTRFAPHPEWIAWDRSSESKPPEMGPWIWHPESDSSKDAPVASRYFLKEVDIPPGSVIKHASLRIGADDRYEAWINGTPVGSGGSWLDPALINLTKNVHVGKNIIAIRADNMPAPVKLNPAGLTAVLEVEFAQGPKLRVATSKEWLTNQKETPGWREGKRDVTWKPAREIGPIGMAPWGPPQARVPFPPLAFGRPEGTKIFYMIDPKPVVIRGLVAGKSYVLREFDPVLGEEVAGGFLSADPAGNLRPALPTHGHDWVIAVLP